VDVSYTEAEYPVPSCGNWEVLQGGLGAISKEHTETGQQIIKKLATEKGLAKIKALADEKVDGVKLQRGCVFLRTERFPFSESSLTRPPSILSSLILETPLDTICTFLFGPNDRRVINLFKSTTSALGTLAREETVKDEDLMSIAVTASLAVLKRIMKLNQSAQVITEFTWIVNDFSTSIPEQLLQAGSRSLDRIRQRLGLGAVMSPSRAKEPSTGLRSGWSGFWCGVGWKEQLGVPRGCELYQLRGPLLRAFVDGGWKVHGPFVLTEITKVTV